MFPLVRLRPGVEDMVLLSGLSFCMKLGFLSEGMPVWGCWFLTLDWPLMAWWKCTHCKEQMMGVQAVPMLKCPVHVFCPHASCSFLCCSSAQEWGLRKPHGPQHKIHCQHTGLNLSWIFSRKKSKSFSFSEHTLALDYISGEVVELSQTLQSYQGHSERELPL